MDQDQAETVLLEVLEQYQEESQLADISGQIETYFQDQFSVPIKTIASMIDVIGESIAQGVMEHLACEEFDVHGDDVPAFLNENVGTVGSRIVTAVSQQVSMHSFCMGFLLSQQMEKEKING